MLVQNLHPLQHLQNKRNLLLKRKVQISFMKILLAPLLVLLFNSCDMLHKKRKEPKISNEEVYFFIDTYIKEKSMSQDYQNIRNAFNLFYKESLLAQRRYYLNLDTAIGERFYGLDSLVIFNNGMDSAILFYIEKLSNSQASGFYFSSNKVFACKENNEWRLYDGCGSAIYVETKYTYLMARNNERLWFAYDGEWLYRGQNDSIQENSNFVNHACTMLCGR